VLQSESDWGDGRFNTFVCFRSTSTKDRDGHNGRTVTPPPGRFVKTCKCHVNSITPVSPPTRALTRKQEKRSKVVFAGCDLLLPSKYYQFDIAVDSLPFLAECTEVARDEQRELLTREEAPFGKLKQSFHLARLSYTHSNVLQTSLSCDHSCFTT
jgi:hypothetical protein